MPKGKVIKTQNSFYHVNNADGDYVCKLRGKFKKARELVVTGDEVVFNLLDEGTGVIEERIARTNYLRRPPVANVDQVVLVFAVREPDPNALLINKFLFLVEWAGVHNIILCFNKADLILEESEKSLLTSYEKIGYKVMMTSTTNNEGIDKLKIILNNGVTVFAGPSGVGKSSILNALSPELLLKTGGLSDKIKRGKHTTRLAQLIKFSGDGYVVDTPGFSMVEFEELSESELCRCLPEFYDYLGQCRFHGCTHSHEPGCAIKKAVEDGSITRLRYDSYLSVLQEIRELKAKKKK